MVMRKDPEKRRAKEQAREEARLKAEAAKAEQERQRAEEAFRQSPQGRARAAHEAGKTLFQLVLSVSATQKAFWGQSHQAGQSTMTRTDELGADGVLEVVESEGWRLEHAGFVFRPTTTESRDRLLATGQVETVMGEIQGVYLFRRADN